MGFNESLWVSADEHLATVWQTPSSPFYVWIVAHHPHPSQACLHQTLLDTDVSGPVCVERLIESGPPGRTHARTHARTRRLYSSLSAGDAPARMTRLIRSTGSKNRTKRCGAIVWKDVSLKCNLISVMLTFLHLRYICVFKFQLYLLIHVKQDWSNKKIMIDENALKQQQPNTLQSREGQPSPARATIQPSFPSYQVVKHFYPPRGGRRYTW